MACLLVIDQSLRGFGGHHLEYDTAVLTAASAAGMQVTLAAHADFPDAKMADAEVLPVFAGTVEESRRSSRRNEIRRALATVPPTLRRPGLRLAGLFARGDTAVVSPAHDFGAAVLRLIESRALTEDDHVFVHTLVGNELLGLALALAGRGDLPSVHVLLRYEEASEPLRRAVGLVRGEPVLRAALRYWTDTKQLAEYYRRLGVDRIGVLPIPHCLPDSVVERPAGSAPLTVSFLGGARRDKGFDLLPRLARGLRDDHLATGRVHLLVQSSYSLSLEEPVIAAAHRRLRRYPASWVTLLEGDLSMPAFHDAMLATDILLLPYRPDVYRRRSSGLLIQAAAAGIPTVVPAETWLSAEALPDAHVTFGPGRSLLEATVLAVETAGGLAAAARDAAMSVRARHSSASLVDALMCS